MRILFAGTPGFAARALIALVQAGHDVALVLTQPDRPAGRGMKLTPSEVKREALAHGLPVLQPPSLKDAEVQQTLRQQHAQLMVVAAYGLILPPAVLESFPGGCINIHASLLPRWRGAAPIQRALLAGDRRTGICIMQMDEGLDTGPVLLSGALDIDAKDTGGSLHDKLAALGANLIVEALAGLAQGGLEAQPQAAEGATYAKKLTKDEARVDWHRDAGRIDAQVRALNPAPVAFTRHGSDTLRLWRARVLDESVHSWTPGTVVAAGAEGIDVACGRGLLRIEQLQRPGSTQQSAADFLRGHPLPAGTQLGD